MTYRFCEPVEKSTGDAVVWLRVWMRIVNLVSPLHTAHSYLAVQTISRTINTLLRLSGTDSLIHWICTRLLFLPPSGQTYCFPAYCAVLSTVSPPPLVEAYILLALARAIVSERFTIVLEYMPFMSKDYLSVLARPALSSLTQLIKQSNFSPRSVQVAALLSPDHAVGETLLLNLLALNSSEVPLQSYSLALHALALLIVERADAKLMTEVINRVCNLKTSASLLHIFCADLNQLEQIGLRDKLSAILEQALDFVKEDCLADEMLWQSVSVSLMDCQLRRSLLERVLNGRKLCLEGFLLTYYRQFPLPSFSLAHCNSVENITGTSQPDALTAGRVFFDQGRAILSVDMDSGVRMTSRTPVGKHCWCFTGERTVRRQMNCVNDWLRKLASRPKKIASEMTSMKGAAEDPFEKLPQLPRTLQADPIECNEMYFFIQQNRRLTTSVPALRHPKTAECPSQALAEEKYVLWRTFAADLRLFQSARQIPLSFNRDIRHLDHIYSREVHKVAVIYVAKGQEDKVSVLSNSCGSVAFNEFVLRLGWQVQIGHNHYGYNGGLPNGVTAPYYASADTEIIFHVSTMLDGDITQKLKHLGNDEVHVVWSENDRPYRRDTIATRFCDVLIVLYQMSPYLFRVRIETQRPLEFGPLFDGAHIHICMLSHLIRDTVVNASRAYRLSQQDCARPLKHREKVFEETRHELNVPPPSLSIFQTFAKMNILPKKKWHVRTKENVARVRRDQKRAKEEEERVAEKAQLAEQEYKVNLLRKNAERMDTMFTGGKSGADDNSIQFTNSSSHVNFFADLEVEHRKNLGIGNREYELEKKKEQEEYEKKVGILQYLGQGSSELTKEKPWYEKVPAKKESEFREWGVPIKKENQLTKSGGRSSVKMIDKRAGSADKKIKKKHKRKKKDKESCHKKRRRKSKHHDNSSLEQFTLSNEEQSSELEESSKKQKLEKLRQERLDREAKERKRLTSLLTPSKSNKEENGRNVAKYNSQFNPALARQNQIR
uniref:Rap-GAP domain-containing protein n=1 Tax=Elaeophora elaphi TaxID=1147741 RepID=A0A0R3RS83_9BILA